MNTRWLVVVALVGLPSCQPSAQDIVSDHIDSRPYDYDDCGQVTSCDGGPSDELACFVQAFDGCTPTKLFQRTPANAGPGDCREWLFLEDDCSITMFEHCQSVDDGGSYESLWERSCDADGAITDEPRACFPSNTCREVERHF